MYILDDDPATGTGGFLLAVLDHIREYVTTHYGTGDWNQYVNAELVKRLFGFELLVAPYTIAHLKLSLFHTRSVRSKSCQLASPERRSRAAAPSV